MRTWHVVPLLGLALLASGCYTTVVETGREPSRRKFRDDWVMGFASGLVMVERVNAERYCANGVARVKTETSLANFVVQTVTAGVLSPRSVEVTCAAGPARRFEWAVEHEFGRELGRQMERAFREREGRERGRVRLRLSREHHFH